ncbi:MAG: ABC transporter ATP-binding protein [Verrucomicrobia bacterium]|nr:ABC transporter ATP-binding protein [Verrucomicrobiota bacterium]
MPLLEIKNLTLDLAFQGATARVVEDVSLQIDSGETVCLVGESGCGKSLTALSIARLVPTPPARYAGGQILVGGQDVLGMSRAELRRLRGRVVSYVFQEPTASLNPVFRVGSQIKESLRLHRPEAATDLEVSRLLKVVGISAPESRMRAYPHELSGGMQQRVMIAMALASQPSLLVADEPTTALDVTVQAQIFDLLRNLKQEFRMSLFLITHNLGVVRDLADRVAVMYAGQIVEHGPADAVLRKPRHPYTKALVNSVPKLGSSEQSLKVIPGQVPRLGAFPQGCRFHPRCGRVRPNCSVETPGLDEAQPNHQVRCPYWIRDAAGFDE